MAKYSVNPFVRMVGGEFENIINGRLLARSSVAGALLRTILDSRVREYMPAQAAAPSAQTLFEAGFLLEPSVDVFAQSNLKYISLETTSICNQRCFFCPVSGEQLPVRDMGLDRIDEILRQAGRFPNFVGVFLNHYNEPFADRRMPQILDAIARFGTKAAINTNASVALDKLDGTIGKGRIEVMTVNLHTADREKYRADRGRDHLETVTHNIRAYHAAGIARQLRIVVLALTPQEQAAALRGVQAAFGDLGIEIFGHQIGDRCGAVTLPAPWQPVGPYEVLAGCEQTGSRVLEHLHLLADGRAIICCEDYHGTEIVGHVERQTLEEILSSEPFKAARRKIYGAERISSDFICARCEFAVPGETVARDAAVAPALGA